MVVLIVVITSFALASVLAGINVGIKHLSQFNIILALLLLLAVIALGPTLYIFRSMFATLGSYFTKIVPLSNWVGREDVSFLHGWTTFYWAWWFAWALFVGTFIARISKGRTVRESTVFVLIPPVVLCLLWFGTFGGTALYQNIVEGYTGVTGNVAAWKLETALFKMFDQLPLTKLLSSVALLLNIVFFVTSSDSGSLIVDCGYHCSRRQSGRSGSAAGLLVYYGRVGRHSTPTWWRAEFAASSLARHRIPLCHSPLGNGRLRLDGVAQRTNSLTKQRGHARLDCPESMYDFLKYED